MGYVLLLTMPAYSGNKEPVQWSPLVFVDPGECRKFGHTIYDPPVTVDSWSIEQVPDAGKFRFLNGVLRLKGDGPDES